MIKIEEGKKSVNKYMIVLGIILTVSLLFTKILNFFGATSLLLYTISTVSGILLLAAILTSLLIFLNPKDKSVF
jgi:hypothetical protein